MAEKRHLEAGGTVGYSKLPRLEAAPGHVLAAGLCRSGGLPDHASDGHYSYQGTYFSYPLQCHESAEFSAHWGPASPYLPCTDGAISQQLRPEKAHCVLYRQEAEGLGTWAPNSSYEKRKDGLLGDTSATQEKWANYSGHTDFIQQGWIQGFPALHSSRVPTGCPSLAVPKPVYRNHVYCADAGYNRKGSLASGALAESPMKQPTNVEWTLPASGHLVKESCESAVAKKSPVAESGFLPLHQSWKDAVAAPAVLSPYRKTFENLQVAPSASVVDASYPAGCNNPKGAPGECARSPCGKVWSKLPPPASPLAVPPGLIYQGRSAACYPLPSYPLTSHEQLVLYQQSVAQAEKQRAVFALPACKSFNFPAGEDPPLLPRTCFTPAPRSYYPTHLENYFYRALGSPPVTSPGLKTSREHGSQQNSRFKIPFEQGNPISACSMAEKASCGSSLPGPEGVRDWPGAEGTAKPASESFWCRQAAPQPCAFRPHHSVERPPGCIDGYRRTQEAFRGAGPGEPEKGHPREERPLCTEKQSALSAEDKKRATGKILPSGACIMIPDSPAASHESCLKGDPPRTRISESSDSSAQRALQSPDQKLRDLKRAEAPPPPPSPPMPVIHNVFSLAPYREYLEGSTDSLHLPSSKGCPVEKPSPETSWQNAEETISPRAPSARSSKMPGALPEREKDVAYNAVAEGGRKDPSGSCIMAESEGGSYVGFCEDYRGCLNVPATSRQGAAGCASELPKEDHVLDLSLKAEGLVDVPHSQRSAGKTEALGRGNGKADGERGKEGPAKGQEAMRDTDLPALQPPQKNSVEEKSNFQSSAAFLYKKFKILKSHAVGSGSVGQQNFPLFQSSSQIAALSNNFSLQRDSKHAVTRENCLPVQQNCQQAVTRQDSLPLQQSCRQAVTRQDSLPLQQSCRQEVTRQDNLPLQQSCWQAVTRQDSLPLQQSCQQVATRQDSLALQQSCQQAATRQDSLALQQSCQQMATRQDSLALQQSCQQAATRQDSLALQQTRQDSLPLQQSCQQAATRQDSLPLQQSCQQAATQQNSLPVQQSFQQMVTRRNSLPIQPNFQQMVTRRNSLPAPHVAHEKSAKPSAQRSSRKCLRQPDALKPPPPAAPAGSPVLGEASALPPLRCDSFAQSPKQYFTSLHASLCAVISDSVSTSSPELLREWLEKVEPEGEPAPKAKAKAKSGAKTPEAPKPSKSQPVWLAFEKVARLLSQLQVQLEAFLFAGTCPFPHVMRAGAVFVPIHMVKEKLFSNLPGASVDHVLQDHKVELRPTTLSEERLLRELDLKTCTSRMLKLLALKQLPDLYPDLLELHWRHCVKEQLGEPAEETGSEAAGAEGLEAAEVSRCLQSAIHVLSLGVKGNHKRGRKCESAPQGEASLLSSETRRPIDTEESQGPSSSSFGTRNAALTPTKGLAQEDAASVAARAERFPLRSGAKRQLSRACRLSGTLQLNLTDWAARSTSKGLHLRKSVVRMKFQKALQERQGHPVLTEKKQKKAASLLLRSIRRQSVGAGRSPRCHGYPEFVGKRIRHLYEEKDKTKAWYRGVVLRIHRPHKDPLKTVYEVKYDSEPEWQYYLKILQDYKKGWLEVDG